MVPNEPIEQAALIMSAGKQLRDWTLRLQNAETRQRARNLPFGDLSIAQTLAVMAVKDHGPLSITRLAELLAVSPPSASAMVDRLVDRGLLTREPDPDDRRKVIVSLSPEADAVYEHTLNAILAEFVQIVNRLGPDTSRKWCEVMLEVRRVINTLPAAAGTPSV